MGSSGDPRSSARTKVIKKSLNPRWEETFELLVSDVNALLRVSVFDSDLIGSDDVIGHTLVALSGASHDLRELPRPLLRSRVPCLPRYTASPVLRTLTPKDRSAAIVGLDQPPQWHDIVDDDSVTTGQVLLGLQLPRPDGYVSFQEQSDAAAAAAAAAVKVEEGVGAAGDEGEEEEKEDRSRKLAVNVVKGKKLRARDAGGTSDAYVSVALIRRDQLPQQSEGPQVRTCVIPKSLDPEWHEAFEMVLRDDGEDDSFWSDVVRVQVYDHDRVTSDDLIGSVDIPLGSLSVRKAAHPVWHTLYDESSQAAGKLLLGLHVVGVAEPARLRVSRVLVGRDLPPVPGLRVGLSQDGRQRLNDAGARIAGEEGAGCIVDEGLVAEDESLVSLLPASLSLQTAVRWDHSGAVRRYCTSGEYWLEALTAREIEADEGETRLRAKMPNEWLVDVQGAEPAGGGAGGSIDSEVGQVRADTVVKEAHAAAAAAEAASMQRAASLERYLVGAAEREGGGGHSAANATEPAAEEEEDEQEEKEAVAAGVCHQQAPADEAADAAAARPSETTPRHARRMTSRALQAGEGDRARETWSHSGRSSRLPTPARAENDASDAGSANQGGGGGLGQVGRKNS